MHIVIEDEQRKMAAALISAPILVVDEIWFGDIDGLLQYQKYLVGHLSLVNNTTFHVLIS